MAHRPTILEDPDVGQKRYQLYKDSIEQFQKALSEGYFLECITLMESLIKDRLESIYNEIKHLDDTSKIPLANISDILDDLNEKELKDQLKEWTKKRNSAIHAMAKLQECAGLTFTDRYVSLRDIAIKGNELFKAIDSVIKKYRKKQSKNNQHP